MNTTPTTEDRIWAVLSHLAALSFGIGIVLPIVGWSDQRRKSKYAAFQCLQALGYQSIGFTVWLLSYLVIIVVVLIVLVTMSFQAEKTGTSFNAASGLGSIIMAVLLLGLFALYALLPIIAAVACALGRDFRYPFMGDRLARYLDYESALASEEPAWLNEDHELRWVAAAGHFSVLIMLWGMLAPLTAWILQGKEHFFLKFQSIQTLLYQTLATLVGVAGGFFYVFGVFLLLVSMGGIGQSGFNPSLGTMTVVVLAACLLIAVILLLSVPLLHILGQWAGYRILKGENYRYPLLGKLVEKQLTGSSRLEEKPS